MCKRRKLNAPLSWLEVLPRARLVLVTLFYFVSFSCLFLVPSSCHALPDVLHVGGLFSADEEQQEMVFRFAVDRINQDTTLLTRSTLTPQVERIAQEDSFHANKK